MALTLALEKTSISITDEITYTNLTDSTSDYGLAGNAARNTLAVFLTAYKVDIDLVETALTVATYDPETATTFTITNSIDGHQRFKFCVIPRYSASTTYLQYDVVWNGTDETWYRAKLNSFSAIAPPNTTYWEVVSDPSTLIDNDGTSSESQNLQYQILETVLDIAARQCLGGKAIDESKDACMKDCVQTKQLSKDVDAIRSLVYWMQVADSRQLYTKGEKFARLADSYCKC